MSDIAIRAARVDEYERVGRLTIDAYSTLERDHLWGGYDAEILDVAGRAETTEILVAVDADDHVLGACTFVSDRSSPWIEWSEPDEVQLRLLAVDTAVRARGIGQALVEECMERARELGRPLLLHTTPHMEPAQRLYERLGFVRRTDRDVHGFPEFPFLAYRWKP
ncbi:MAG: N-acetyltransferase [Actinomycetia bacterium]|nr:N-acetyltransferase [Actinomycetes bacterium]